MAYAEIRPNGNPTEVVRQIHRRIAVATGVELPMTLWDGTPLGPQDGSFRIVLANAWALRAVLLSMSDLSAGEAYARGAIDIQGDVIAGLAVGQRVGAAKIDTAERLRIARLLMRLPRPPKRPLARRASLRGRMHSKSRDRAAIAFHYDLSQAFYESFLDRGLVYSCAYFADPGETLEAAQTRKLDLICRKLRLRPGVRLLDIGCGWGSLLLHAAKNFGVSGVGVTLSHTQATTARERIAEAGLADQIDIRLQDYRDLDESFDAIASVGMVEHVGPAKMLDYTKTAHRLLNEGGLFLSHGIVIGDPKRVRRGNERSFVSAYVFPDGGLVPAWRAVREMEYGGFEVLDVEQLRPHYALTLRQWIRRLEANRAQAVTAASEMDYRIWRIYMAGSALSFEEGSLGVVQVLGSKNATPPLGRAWMIPPAGAGTQLADASGQG